MKAPNRIACVALVAAAAWTLTAQAQTSPQDLARLGKELTPFGAEKAGNADGSIPAWEGGLTQPPAGWVRDKGYANPYAADKPLATITAANAGQYQTLLAPGQLELLKRYPEYKLLVYPTRRSAGYPQWYLDSIAKIAAKASLEADGKGVKDLAAAPAVPFPVPKSGAEVMENHKLRFRGDSVRMTIAHVPVQSNGAFTPSRWAYELNFSARMPDAEPGRLFYFRQRTLSPSNFAGEAAIKIDLINIAKESPPAWTYNPGQRRVLRAPDLGYDTPSFNVDGLATVDDLDLFNGSLDRFDWKLVGKKEMFISYNNYALADKRLKYADVLKSPVPDAALVRYERHRVWVVEATLKAGARHVYGKRVFYVDEDTWQIAHADEYDQRGGLWRVQEGHEMQYYDAPTPWYALTVLHDLQARRYWVYMLQNEDKMPIWNQPLPRGEFTADALRRGS